MPREEIFVSYSHRDRHWLEELVNTLKPLTRKRRIETWDDTKIGVGSSWRQEISAALGRAKIAVLLVSRSFLASEFIAEHELPPLLDAAKREGTTIVWIAIGHSLYEQTDIAEYQAANDPSRPLNSLSESDADLELVKIARAIDRILDDQTQPSEDEARAVAESDTDKASSEADDVGMTASDRIRQALADGRWAWRSVEALAAKAAITPDETLKLIRADSEIELGRAKSGRTIARLRTRLP
jgi:hypothetical protein